VAPRISVVICAYTEERWQLIDAAVASVDAQSYQAHELVLVADHNPALQARLQKEKSAARHVVVANGEDPGLSGARNAGIAAATGDVIAFMDDDARADRDWLREIASAYDDPRVIAAGGTIRPDWVAERPAWWPEEFDWVIGCSYRGLPMKRGLVRNLIGCNMSFRRSVFEAVGGFRVGFGRARGRPLGGEETELCIRASTAFPGRLILYVPDAVVDHHVPDQRATWAYFSSRCFAEGLSKAAVAGSVGSGSGLSSERRYVRRVLPEAVIRETWSAVRLRAPSRLLRVAAIMGGLSYTITGYAVGSLSRALPDLRWRGGS